MDLAPIVSGAWLAEHRDDVVAVHVTVGGATGGRCVEGATLLDRWPPTEADGRHPGITAAHDALAMEHAGLGLPRVDVGSWSQWCRDPSRPVARG